MWEEVGQQYQQGSVKLGKKKKVSSWFRTLAFLHISELDGFFYVLIISAALSKPRMLLTSYH